VDLNLSNDCYNDQIFKSTSNDSLNIKTNVNILASPESYLELQSNIKELMEKNKLLEEQLCNLKSNNIELSYTTTDNISTTDNI